VQAGRGVKIVIPLALRRKVAKITGKIGCAWGKDFCTLRRDPEKQGVMNTARGSRGLGSLGTLIAIVPNGDKD
jgi:hypothetical protein